MTMLITLAVLFVVVGLAIEFFKIRPSRTDLFRGGLYQIRYSLMSNRSEEAFFFELQKQLPNNFHIFPKVRIADILKTKDGHEYYKSRNKILPKHVDFLICDHQFKPRMAIEINGSSHRRQKVIESDELKRKIFEEVGFPLRVVTVGESFSEVVKEIIAKLSSSTVPLREKS